MRVSNNIFLVYMKNSFFLTLAFLLVSFSSFSQKNNSKSDKYNSLQVKIEKNISEDTADVIQYIQLFKEWAIEDGLVAKQAQAYLFFGDYYYYQQDLIKSTSNYEIAANIAISSSENLDSVYCFSKVYMAYNYNEMNLYDKSLNVLFEGIQYAKNMQDQSFLADYYSNISGAYFYKGNHDLAIVYVDSCLALEKQLKDTLGIIKALNNFGKINEKEGFYKEALVSYEESLLLQNLRPTKNKVLSILISNMGNLYQKISNTKAALIKYDVALKLSKIEADTVLIISNYLNIGQIKDIEGNIDVAIQYYRKAERLLGANSLESQKIYVFNHLAKTLIRTGDYKQAKNYLNQSFTISKTINLKKQLKTTYELYSELNKYERNYEEALRYFQKSVDINNEIQNIETQEKIAELNSKYNFEDQLNEIDELKKINQIKALELEKNTLQRKGLILLIILIFIIVLFLVIIGIRRYKRIILNKEALLNHKEKEIENLQSIIEKQLNENEIKDANSPLVKINNHIKNPLTNKEYEILCDVQKGFKNKEIAEKQFISVNTVKFHLKNIYDKLDVGNRVQAIQLLKK